MSSTSKLMEKYKSSKTRSSQVNELSDNDVRIVFDCREGSVTHYYHFFYGALIPLIEFHVNNPDKRLLITTSVGPFETIIRELFDSSVLIGFEEPVIPRGAVYYDDKSMNYVRTPFPGEVILPAYDLFNNKMYRDSRSSSKLRRLGELRDLVNNFIESRMPDEYRRMQTYDMLLIERNVDEYYSIKRSQNRDPSRDIYYTSGKERRNILNHVQMSQELNKLFGSRIENVVLEKKSIFYQYQLFKHASIVIGQHGAGLANIYFMRPNTNLVEVMSPWGIEGNHFSNLADFLRINYGYTFMERDEDNVNINQLISITERMTRRKSSPTRKHRSRSRSPQTRRRRSRSPPRRQRSISRSPPRRQRSISRSPPRRQRSRSRSPPRRYRSRSRSPSRRDRSRGDRSRY